MLRSSIVPVTNCYAAVKASFAIKLNYFDSPRQMNQGMKRSFVNPFAEEPEADEELRIENEKEKSLEEVEQFEEYELQELGGPKVDAMVHSVEEPVEELEEFVLVNTSDAMVHSIEEAARDLEYPVLVNIRDALIHSIEEAVQGFKEFGDRKGHAMVRSVKKAAQSLEDYVLVNTSDAMIHSLEELLQNLENFALLNISDGPKELEDYAEFLLV
jgi:hypothetical protein